MSTSVTHRALSALATTSPEYGPGFTDHTAMAVEALERLDPGAIEAFVARYTPRLRPLAREQDEALGGFARRVAEERAALDRHGVFAVLSARTLDVLAPGVVGAAFHGLIRVGHGVRALDRDPSPERIDELARGLAYAAIRNERLPPPAPRQPGAPGLSLPQALESLAPAAAALTHVPGMITGTLLARSRSHPTLRAVSGGLSLDPDPARAASELRSAAVRLITEGEYHPGSLFTLLHGVTGMDAVCALVPRVDPGAAQALIASAGHALLALRVSYIGRLRGRDLPPSGATFSALRDRAVRSLDDHAIKLAAALDEAEREQPSAHHAAALALWLDALGV